MMITYRKYKEEDFEKVKLYCSEHNIAMPEDGFMFIAVNDLGEIEGIAGMKRILFLEPLISNNGVVANNLFRMLDGIAQANDAKELWCITDQDKTILFNKVGFEVIESNKILMEKRY